MTRIDILMHFDYECDTCWTREARDVPSAERDNQRCEECGDRLHRLTDTRPPAAPSPARAPRAVMALEMDR